MEQYLIPLTRINELNKRIEKFAKKSNKFNLQPIEIKIVGETIIKEVINNKETGRVTPYKIVELSGKAPSLNDHTFIARVEHTEAGNILSKSPGAYDIEIPKELREGGAYCDHCKKIRKRNDTFILKNNLTEDFIRVGRTCLQDFFRGTSPSGALSIWTLLEELKDFHDKEPSYKDSGDNYYNLKSIIATSFKAIKDVGWVSKKVARDCGKVPTANRVLFASEPKSLANPIEWESAQPKEEDFELAGKAIIWAGELEGDSEYEHNLKVACSLEYVSPKNIGLVVSLAAIYNKHLEQKSTKEASTSTHFGEVDKKYIRELKVVKQYEINGQYGLTICYTLVDDAGNIFKWFSSGGCRIGGEELKGGDKYYFTFSVKRHGVFNEIPETYISRAKPTVEPPNHKWVNKLGEIFKTRKELEANGA